jgi:hypothetical protein
MWIYFILYISFFIVVLQIWSRWCNLCDILLITFVRSSLNPWGDNASADEGHLYLTSLCCLVLNSKHLRTSPQHLVSIASLTKHLRMRERKENPSQATRATKNTRKPSLKSLMELSWIGGFGEDQIYLMCLGVESFALVLNAMFGMLGCLWIRWLGVFISPTTSIVVGEAAGEGRTG